jgi:flagellin-like protein
MSYKTFNAKQNRAKKGISPVIATVILVAVAVVIAAALAGFSSSLFGTYSSAGAAVTVKAISMDSTGAGTVTLTNGGNVADELTSVSIVGFPPAVESDGTLVFAAPATDFNIPPNGGELVATFEIGDITADPTNFNQGQVVTIRMNLSSGAQITQSVIVTP